jgi:hypothetical protein
MGDMEMTQNLDIHMVWERCVPTMGTYVQIIMQFIIFGTPM